MPTKKEYREALSDLELAVHGLELSELVRGWGEPRYRPGVGVKLSTNSQTVYWIHDALCRASELVNTEDT